MHSEPSIFNKKAIRDRLIVLKDRGEFGRVIKRANKLLENYIGENNIVQFRTNDNSISFKTEQISPNNRDTRPNVLFLFSNPHPDSVEQGMFLSPSANNKIHNFWTFMQKSGWFKIPNNDLTPNNLANVFTDNTYDSEFNIFFKCFYEFPTKMPKDLETIFEDYFITLKEDSLHDMKGYVIREGIDYILVFNGKVFEILTGVDTNGFTKILNNSELIKQQFIGNNPHQNSPIPIFLTYPAGWRYHKNITELRHTSLTQIKQSIISMAIDQAEQG